jgi:hypothetical protein
VKEQLHSVAVMLLLDTTHEYERAMMDITFCVESIGQKIKAIFSIPASKMN